MKRRERIWSSILAGALALVGGLAPAARVGHAQSMAGSPDPTRLTIARLHYEGGGDWYANPSSLPNLLARIGSDTRLRVAPREATVTPLSPDLYDYPYLYMTGHGNVAFSEAELRALRRYLLSGGFLHADDNYGMDESFRREIRRLFPDKQLLAVPVDHPIYRILHPMPDGLPKVHEHDGLPAEGLGIFHEGRLIVFYSYQSDLGDGWEDPDVHDDPQDIRERALRMGVNLFVFALAQRKPL